MLKKIRQGLGITGLLIIVGAGNILTALIGLGLMSLLMIEDKSAEREFDELP